MNERIRELAELATLYTSDVCYPDDPDWHETRDQRFAELLIRECAEAALTKGRASPDTDFRTGSILLSEYLLVRFGVEE
jgi:hypothetical protein